MKIDILTLFPDMFDSPFSESMIKRTHDKGLVEINKFNLRDWALDSYGTVDDKPFGGGIGMLFRPEPIYNALNDIRKDRKPDKANSRVIVMSAGGKTFSQEKAEELSRLDNLIFVCCHYEGFDQRIIDFMADEVISIGDYVLTGGEIPAMAVIDATVRLIPGVLGKDESSSVESFSKIKIDGKDVRTPEYPQYTRPREFMGHKVPEVLLSGDPKKVDEWQKEQIRKKLEDQSAGGKR